MLKLLRLLCDPPRMYHVLPRSSERSSNNTMRNVIYIVQGICHCHVDCLDVAVVKIAIESGLYLVYSISTQSNASVYWQVIYLY